MWVTVGHVDPGQRTGIAYRNFVTPPSPGGGDPGNLFPALATDGSGNVYVAWIDERDNNVYVTVSTDESRTWSQPIQVNSAPANTNEFRWAKAKGSTLVLAWYGTDKTSPSGPDGMPSWFTTRRRRPTTSGSATSP